MESQSLGVSEMILVLLALGGFGAAANPSAPPAAEVLRYAPAEVDFFAHLDVEAVVPRNYDAFRKLPSDPALRGVPSVQTELAAKVTEVEKGVADLKAKVGIDVVRDIRSLTLFVTFKAGKPEFLMAARGKFGGDFITKVAKSNLPDWTRANVGGRPGLASKDGAALATVVPDGTLLAGTPSWVKERAGTWSPRAGGVTDEIRAALDEKPIFLVASRPRPETVALLQQELRGNDEKIILDFMTGHESAAYAVAWNGVWWTYTARTPLGYQRALLATDGLIQLMRAGHLAMRGAARLGLSVVDSYTDDPSMKKVSAQKADLLRIVDTWSGDGTFAATVDRKEAERRVTARLTGKTLSEVLPTAGIAILIALGAVL